MLSNNYEVNQTIYMDLPNISLLFVDTISNFKIYLWKLCYVAPKNSIGQDNLSRLYISGYLRHYLNVYV